MDEDSAEAWKRLGNQLERRRGQLGYGYRQRRRFWEERGPNVSLKTLVRLERGERHVHSAETIATIEALYGLVPGAIARFMGNGAKGELEVPFAAPRGPRYLDPLLNNLSGALADCGFPDDDIRAFVKIAARIQGRMDQEREQDQKGA